MKYLILSALIAYASAACSTQFPNGTETNMLWWQCDNGKYIQVYNATPFDSNGNYEYPIHLGKPLIMQLNLNNPTHTYTKPNLRDTIKIWEWSSTSCNWISVPTLGLLTNQDACSNGITCPVNPGKQWLKVIIDFTPYAPIINALQDNTSYQLQYSLNDKTSGDSLCLMFQARAYIH